MAKDNGLPIEPIVRIEVRPLKKSKGASDPHFIRIVGGNHEPGFKGEESKTLASSRALALEWGQTLDLPVYEFDVDGRRVK